MREMRAAPRRSRTNQPQIVSHVWTTAECVVITVAFLALELFVFVCEVFGL